MDGSVRSYFELHDDLAVSGRWHLGEIVSPNGSEPALRSGVPVAVDAPLSVAVTHDGVALDFSLTSFAVPIATTALADAICAVAGPDVQRLPVRVAGGHAMEVLNATRVLRCLDETRSTFTKWTDHDHRADLAGQYRQVTTLVVDAEQIPPDAHFFRVSGWPIALVVSLRVKAAMETAGCLGARFTSVSPTDRA